MRDNIHWQFDSFFRFISMRRKAEAPVREVGTVKSVKLQ